MKLQKRQDLPDDVTRSLAVVKQVECVRRGGVVGEGQGEIVGVEQEAVERFVQLRHFVVA